MLSGLFYHLFGLVHFLHKGCLLVLLLQCFIAIPVVSANSVDPDQSPCSAVSDWVCTVLNLTDVDKIFFFQPTSTDIYFSKSILCILFKTDSTILIRTHNIYLSGNLRKPLSRYKEVCDG